MLKFRDHDLELFLVSTTIRDVGRGAEPFFDLALVADHRHSPRSCPADAAVLTDNPMLKAEERCGSHGFIDRLYHARLVANGDVRHQPRAIRTDSVGKEASAGELAHHGPFGAHLVDNIAGRLC